MAGTAISSSVAERRPDYEEPDAPEDEFIPALDGDEAIDELPSEEEQEAVRLAEIEARARRQGWRPLAEYRGPAGKWVDAETFLERGEQFLPFVRKDLEQSRAEVARMGSEIDGLRRTVEEQKQSLNELLQFARNADQAGYNRAKAELEADMRQAVVDGNTEAFDEAKEKLDTLAEGRATRVVREPERTAPESRPQPQPKVAVDPVAQAFVNANPWFERDPSLASYMNECHLLLQQAEPGLSLAENLEKAKEMVIQKFPEKFGRQREPEPQPRQPVARSRVVTPSRSGASPTAVRDPFGVITDAAEREAAKKAYTRMKAQMPSLTATEYVTLYLNPHADVLQLRREAAARKGKG